MLNILVVDDEPDLCQSLAQVLREQGHTVEVAGDGESALARLVGQSFRSMTRSRR